MLHGDDYANTVSGLGTARDKSTSTFFASRPPLTPDQLDALYENEPIAARIVDRVVDDATREPFTLEGVDKTFDVKGLMSELEAIDALNKLADGWRWARLYGGAIVLMVVNDAQELDQPLQLDRAGALKGLVVLEAPCAKPADFMSCDFSAGDGVQFRRPRFYQLSANTGGGHVAISKIHHSRVIRFDGVRIPPQRTVNRTDGWGPSVLERPLKALRSLGTSMGYAENILHEISLLLLKVAGLRKQLLGSSEDKASMRKGFEEIRRTIDTLGLLVLDADDDFTEQTRSVAGLDALLQRFVDALVRSTDMPRTILLGEQPGGLNANSEGETRGWYDHVALQQPRILTPAINRVLDVVFRLRAKRSLPVPAKWTIGYPSLWQPSDKEQADTRLVEAQADTLDITSMVTSAEEVRARRISKGEITPLVAGQGAENGT